MNKNSVDHLSDAEKQKLIQEEEALHSEPGKQNEEQGIAAMNDISEKSGAEQDFIKVNEENAKLSARLSAANEELERHKSLFNSLIDAIPDIVFFKDKEGVYLGCNPSFLKITGKSKDEIIGKTDYDIFEKGTADLLRANDIDIITKNSMITFEELIPLQTGDTVLFETRKLPFSAGNDDITGILGISIDITERKHNEEDLKQSEQRYQALVEWSPTPALVHRNMIILYVNPAAVKLFGVPSEKEIVGTPVLRWHHPDYHQIVRERIRKAAEEGLAAPMIESKYFKLDGTVMDLEVQGMPIIYNGSPSIFATFNDVTERNRVEKFKNENEARYRSMIANISDVISIVDAEGLIKYKSPNVERLFGWSPEEQIGLSGFITTHPDDIEYVQKMLLPLLQEENSRKTIELRFQCKDGSYKPVEITATNMLSDPLINGVLMNYHDISERKKGEEERARQSALINSLLDSIPDMVFFKDLEGAYLGCNPSFVEFVGKSRNEIIGRTDFDLFEKEVAGSFRHHDLKMLQNKRPNQNEEWITYPDGRKALLDTLKTPYLDNDGTLIGVLGVSRDITARKQAEIALVESSNKWAAIIKASPDGIGLFSLDGKIEFISDRYAFIHGFSIDEKFLYLGKSVYDFIDPSEHQVLADNFRKLISGEKDNPISEYIGIKKDKTRFVLSVNSAVLFSNDGKPANILVISRDITGQKVTEKRIMESEQRLQMVMDVTREAMWDLDIPSGKVLHNKQWYTLLGKQEGDIAGTLEAFDDIIHPDDKASVLEKIDAVMQGKADLYLSEHRLIGKDKTIWVQDRGAVVERDEQGNPLRMVGSYADITDRKKAENELKESLNRFDLLARHSRVFHWEVDASGLYTFVSDPVKDILGYEQEEIIGKKHFYDLHPGKGREAFKSGALEAFALKLPFSDLENPVESKTGEILWVSTNGLPIEDEKGNLTGYRGSDTDITLRKKSEEENIKLSKGIEQSSISIFITDGNGIIEYANPKFFEMTGYASNEIIGKPPRMFQSGKTPVETYKNLWETILSGKEWHGELLNRKKNGELYWESMSVSQVLNSRGEIINFIAIKEDITTRKQNERELLEANRSLELTTVKANELAIEAESSNRAKSVFLANMSHEIRTPLNAIIGFSQLLKREKLLTDSQIEYSNSINRAGEHLLQLINDILEYSKIEAGREVLNPINFNLPALLSEMQMMFKEEANSRKLQLIVEIPGELLQFVFADEQKLRRILINLIGNAVKFTTEGGVSVRSRIIKIDEHTSRFIAEVEDSGPGIPEQELGRLFKQFEQTSSGIKNSGGTGLGLVLSRQLALLMNGDITVASEEGTGSVFTINVEIREGKSEVGDVPIVKRVTGIKNPLYNYRVLVVDDKEENRMVIGNFLSLAGFETIYAVNGADGITKFEQWNPHLILMDMRMPEMDGYEATRLIKSTEKGKQTPVIVVTASSFEEEKKKNLGLEIQGYIRKPFRESELFGAIGKALGIEYTYEEETTTDTLMEYLSNDGIVDEDIAKLPHELVLQMKDAADAADFILLKELICQIDGEYSSLAKHLILRADSFDYNYFQKSLKTAEGKNEKPD